VILANRVTESQVDPGVPVFFPYESDTGPFSADRVVGGGP